MASTRRGEVDRSRSIGDAVRLGVLIGLLMGLAMPALAGHDWNKSEIDWQAYDKGLAAASAQSKPICLVFFTEWCPHCANYSRVFHDPRVVAASKQFVMILLDKDQNKEISAQYSPDGQYIPRTYFLSPDGKLDADLHAPREQYRYFYDEKDAASILAGMDAALAKLSGKRAPARTSPQAQAAGAESPVKGGADLHKGESGSPGKSGSGE